MKVAASGLFLALVACASAPRASTPGAAWASKLPAEVGMDAGKLAGFSEIVGGRGCVVRRGFMGYSWGDVAARGDIASAAKPIYAHFLFKAVEEGRLAGLDARVVEVEPRLAGKDRGITFRHLANQVSCYGVTEEPGTAYDYNDWQMALFWDALFLKVHGATLAGVDAAVLRPKLMDLLQCEDAPTFLAFGPGNRPGRVAVSPRDHARFGLLYLREGDWGGRRVLSREHARMAVTSPLPNSIPRTAGKAADMIPGQRSIGSTRVPDDQTDHLGSYSWLWWTNGVDRAGKRHWPDAPVDAYASLGHGGKRALVVVPSLDLVAAWNDSKIEGAAMENEALRLLAAAVTD